MGRRRHTPEQIITALREVDVGLASGKTAAMVSLLEPSATVAWAAWAVDATAALGLSR